MLAPHTRGIKADSARCGGACRAAATPATGIHAVDEAALLPSWTTGADAVESTSHERPGRTPFTR